MDIMELIKNRHSVRKYLDKEIEKEKVDILMETIEEGNLESGLNIQLILNEPEAFKSIFASYGRFVNVKNYIALVGKEDDNSVENCGYYGAKVVLKAQEIGLNTCFVGMNYKKMDDIVKIKDDEKYHLVITLGYGQDQGVPRKSKSFEQVTQVSGEVPDWFRKGVEAALLAPTAINQQRFVFSFEDNKVFAKEKMGFYSKVDLGIAKYFFELGAGKENFIWG